MPIWIAAIAALALLAGPALAQEGPTLKRIVSTKTLNVAYRDSAVPFSYAGPDGKPMGYSIDICMKIADAIKEEFKLDRLEIKYVPVTTQTRIPLMANGTTDIECAATAMTLGRHRQVDFLTMTFVSGARMMVRKDAGIQRLEDLNGKILTTLLGTTSEKAVTAEIQRKGLKVDLVKVRDNPQALLNLEQNRADAFFSDEVMLHGLKSTAKNPAEYVIVGESPYSEPFALMVPRNDAEFRLLGNRVIVRLFASREIVPLYAKWFEPGPTNINLPMSDRLKAAIDLLAIPE